MGDLQAVLAYYAEGVRFPDVSGFEVLELLCIRSRLASAETDLNARQRTQLEEADSDFMRDAHVLYKRVAMIGELDELRRRNAVPPSHWWWYLDRLGRR